jgi:prepilin-type N-terminal cleavage/methylation domain-containing protein
LKPHFSNQTNRALTMTEVLVVIAMLAVVAVIILPMIAASKKRTSRIGCASNLRQIVYACRIWEGDNGDKYPMGISVTNGGSLELAATGNVLDTFLVMSNNLSTPRILHCPEDTNSFSAANFSAGFNNQNISYFVGLDAGDNYPQRMLSGDDNFEIGGVPVKSGLLEVPTNTPIAWTAARHKFVGNIGLCDGSVQEVDNSSLASFFNQTGVATNRLAIP